MDLIDTPEKIEKFNEKCTKICDLSNKIFDIGLNYEPIKIEEPKVMNSWYRAYQREAEDQMRRKFYQLFKVLSRSRISRPAPPFITIEVIFNMLDDVLNKLQKY